MGDRWASFDCYGTLVDWMGGIHRVFAELWPDADDDIEPGGWLGLGCVWINRLTDLAAHPRRWKRSFASLARISA